MDKALEDICSSQGGIHQVSPVVLAGGRSTDQDTPSDHRIASARHTSFDRRTASGLRTASDRRTACGHRTFSYHRTVSGLVAGTEVGSAGLTEEGSHSASELLEASFSTRAGAGISDLTNSPAPDTAGQAGRLDLEAGRTSKVTPCHLGPPVVDVSDLHFQLAADNAYPRAFLVEDHLALSGNRPPC